MAETGETRRVVLVDFPLRVAYRAYQYKEALLREFAIIALGGGEHVDVPKRLVEIATMLDAKYTGINPEADARVDDAVARGDTHVELELTIPLSMRDDTLEVAPLLNEADAYCRNGDLLTLAPSDEVRAFWVWFLSEFIRQADGLPPQPWRDFTLTH